MGPIAVLFRVDLIVFFVVVCRWCVVPLSEVLSTKRSTVFELLGALGTIEPHGQRSDLQLTGAPGERLAVAVDRDVDFFLHALGKK